MRLRASFVLSSVFLSLGLTATAQLQSPPQQLTAPRQQQQPTQQQGQLDGSKSLFAVLAAINAAGFDNELESVANHPLRKALREHLAQQKIESVFELKRFVRDHRQKDPGADLSQYISFALLLNDPPDFSFTHPDRPQPPDVAALEGFLPLLAQFYREAKLEELWKRVQPAYDQMIALYHEPVSRAVLEANVYLRNSNAGSLGRRFQIYLDLLGPPNQVQTRNYVDDYFVVVTPVFIPPPPAAPELPIDEIRHAYLRYLVDPLPLKYSKGLKERAVLADWAQVAPALDEAFKKDFFLLATECFIKAVESRISRKQAMVDQALREGFILTAAFADQLAIYEKQEQSMRLYFPDLIAGINVRAEQARLERVNFVQERPVKKIRVVAEVKPPELTGAAKTLDDAEKAYTDRDLGRAKDIFLRVLKETDDKALHAKAYYGLARIATLEKDPEKAYGLFKHVLELPADAYTKSWSLLYLGRLTASQKDPELQKEAEEFFKAAMAVDGVSDRVKQDAEKGLKDLLAKRL